MTSYVDMMGNVRWTEQAHIERDNAETRSDLSEVREFVLNRRLSSVFARALYELMPAAPAAPAADPYADVRQVVAFLASKFSPLTSAAMQELSNAATVLANADASASQARSDSALLDTALDYEEQRAALAALPPAPTDGSTDPYADQRSSLQSQMNAASTDTTNLVSQRDAWRLANGATVPGQPIPAQ